MNNDILIIIYRDNYEDMFRAMNELMNYPRLILTVGGVYND